jgi:hypothetical protein
MVCSFFWQSWVSMRLFDICSVLNHLVDYRFIRVLDCHHSGEQPCLSCCAFVRRSYSVLGRIANTHGQLVHVDSWLRSTCHHLITCSGLSDRISQGGKIIMNMQRISAERRNSLNGVTIAQLTTDVGLSTDSENFYMTSMAISRTQ